MDKSTREKELGILYRASTCVRTSLIRDFCHIWKTLECEDEENAWRRTKKKEPDSFLESFLCFIGGNSVITESNKNLFGKVILTVFKLKQMKDDMNLALDTCLEFNVCSYFLWESSLKLSFPWLKYTQQKKKSNHEDFYLNKNLKIN